MSSDHRKNTASPAEPRLVRNGVLQSGQCSSESKELEYAHSNSNRKLNPSIDQPPPYAMENDANMQNARPQPTQGEAAADQRQPTTNPDPIYAHHGIEPKESLFSRFCEYIKPTPFFTINFSPYFTLNFNIYHIVLAVIIFAIWSWASRDSSKTP